VSTGHVRKRSAGSWEIRYRVPRPDGPSKVRTETVKGSKRDAEKALRQRLTAVDAGQTLFADAKMPFSEWLETWLRNVRPSLATRSHATYTATVRNYLSPALGHIPLGQVNLAHIQKACADWAMTGRRDGKPGGLSAANQHYNHRVLFMALENAREAELIPRNPASLVRKRLPKHTRREIKVFDDQQGKDLQAAAGSLYTPSCSVAPLVPGAGKA
jgi:integrase